jgi:hypothetical protein
MLCERSRSARVPIDSDRLHEIKHDGHRLIVQREGSHASASASAATTSLSGRFDISVQATGLTRHITESSRIALPRALGLHLTRRSVAGDGRVMFLKNLMLQARCFAWYTLRKYGRCGGDESGGRKCDDRCLHFSILPPWNKKPAQRLKLDPFRKRAASRCGEGAASRRYPVHTGDALVGVKRPDDFPLSDELAPPHRPAQQAKHAIVGFGTEASRRRLRVWISRQANSTTLMVNVPLTIPAHLLLHLLETCAGAKSRYRIVPVTAFAFRASEKQHVGRSVAP